MGKQARAWSWLDVVRKLLYWTGIGWLTPLVGTQDRADLEYLRESIIRDREWLDSLLRDPANQASGLAQVRADLAALLGEAPGPGTSSGFLQIRYPWHVPSGWTDYGGIRVALLAALPAQARPAALAELRCMEPLVLAGLRPAWSARLTKVQDLIAASPDSPEIPHDLQGLWREIDFGRGHWRIRVAKNTTITSITWFLVLAATITATVMLDRLDHGTGCGDQQVDPWFIALLGLLGGSISALRTIGLIGLEERGSVEVEVVRLRLRPVVGAAMAIVIYVLGRSAIAFELVCTTAKVVATAAATTTATTTTTTTGSAPIQI
ncbi:MAG TPA: hypothetical protein VK607_09785, partial [Kofleriaceae bacterium]|nr:hypothetical protein [Kofleriaceae bacterium]